MSRSQRPIARLHTTMDLGAVMNLSGLTPAEEPEGFATRGDEDGDEPVVTAPSWGASDPEMNR